MNFLFLTTNNLATNPRLLKELRLVVKYGHDATVYMFKHGDWSDIITENLLPEFKNVKFVNLPANRKPFIPWFIGSVLQIFFRKFPLFTLHSSMLSIACTKKSYLLNRALNNYNISHDWIIAHNPGAFYHAMRIAKKTKAKFGIDVEDFHPGETTNSKLTSISLKLMNHVLNKSAYNSYASDLIKTETLVYIPLVNHKQVVINNCFSQQEFNEPSMNSHVSIKLVWFSQHITFGRGIELYINIVDQFYPKFELHLYGNLNEDFNSVVIKNKKGIVFKGILSQLDLHLQLSDYDIGLAVDIPINRNRDLALTNKIIAYKQAGLFILASDTLSHKKFLETYSNGYFITNQSSAFDAFNFIENNISQIREEKNNRFQEGKELSWEHESLKLLSTWGI